MSLIHCSGLGLAYGTRIVLDGIDLRIEPRDRLAVVGANGAGKTSLLELIAGVLEPTSGEVERQRGLVVAYLPQDAPEPIAGTLLDEVMASREDLVSLHAELGELERRMADGGAGLEAVLERYGELQHAYQDAGGYELEVRAREALGGLGLGEALEQLPNTLSGGQKRRLELAKLLVQDAALLLVDEPTNHLDLASIEWLEEFMRGVSTATVLVSHDRRFLDNVCSRVLELAGGFAEDYPGNYTQYVRLRGERRERRRREYSAQQAYIAHQEEFIRRYRAGQRAREARGRQTKLDRLDRIAPPTVERRPHLRFATVPSSNVVFKATALVAGHGSPLLSVPPVTVVPGERIAIVGPNGSGKSTLLHTLAGDLAPLTGRVSLGPRTERRLYRQDLGFGSEHGLVDVPTAAEDRTVLEDLLASHPIGEERARTVLGSLLFSGDDVHKRVGDLSGGERARLLMGKLALEETNLLLLDEPTNHLDIPAQEVLEHALLRYPGAVVLVSHDRALIDAIATHVWAIEESDEGPAANRVRTVIGGYSDLQRERQREQAAQRRAVTSAASANDQRSIAERMHRARATVPSRSIRELERQIAEAESRLATLRALLLEPATFADPASGAEAGREHDRVSGALAELYERWEKEMTGVITGGDRDRRP
ncbi:MAG: ABC-F family ATP-binding cassette domain-containing protein [Candidatus Dormibacteraeota bacterium]|nr:ABC-F family ATP-binding cassette domain-containing protein [Candidatus Dormibacteraeota bacterium]